MDSSFARNLDFGWLPAILILAGIGAVTIAIGTTMGAYWVISHLHWVS
jgi:hypothetical protein